MNIPVLIKELLLWSVLAAFVGLSATSLWVFDVTFIKQNPWTFLAEILFVAIIPTLIYVGVFVKTRYVEKEAIWPWIIALSTKFGFLHLAFQLSGVYTTYFSRF